MNAQWLESNRYQGRLHSQNNVGMRIWSFQNCWKETAITSTPTCEAQSPIHTRCPVRGRSEVMRLNYRIEEDVETIQYCDVMSLYPYIGKYFKFPIGHPIIDEGAICKSIGTCQQMEGLIKSTVVPPADLYHPVLPYRWNKKLLFFLCSTCAEKRNMRGQFQNFSDA